MFKFRVSFGINIQGCGIFQSLIVQPDDFGANLSFKGLPCPNIFAGGHNFHGKLEFVPLESMIKASKVILNIISLFAE